MVLNFLKDLFSQGSAQAKELAPTITSADELVNKRVQAYWEFLMADIAESRVRGITSYRRAIIVPKEIEPHVLKAIIDKSGSSGIGSTGEKSNLIVFETKLSATLGDVPIVLEFMKNHRIAQLTTDILGPEGSTDDPVYTIPFQDFLRRYYPPQYLPQFESPSPASRE